MPLYLTKQTYSLILNYRKSSRLAAFGNKSLSANVKLKTDLLVFRAYLFMLKLTIKRAKVRRSRLLFDRCPVLVWTIRKGIRCKLL